MFVLVRIQRTNPSHVYIDDDNRYMYGQNIERDKFIRYYIHCPDIVYPCFGYMDKAGT